LEIGFSFARKPNRRVDIFTLFEVRTSSLFFFWGAHLKSI